MRAGESVCFHTQQGRLQARADGRAADTTECANAAPRGAASTVDAADNRDYAAPRAAASAVHATNAGIQATPAGNHAADI